MSTKKATKAFHVWNPDTGRTETYNPGDDVPGAVVDTVGDHLFESDDDGDGELKGQALDDAVTAANDAGADIKKSATADEKRAALAGLA